MNRKVNQVLIALKCPFFTDMGHSVSLSSTSTYFKFSPYNRALYTIKPSLTPPPQQLPVSDLETQVICHQRGEQQAQHGSSTLGLTALSTPPQNR